MKKTKAVTVAGNDREAAVQQEAKILSLMEQGERTLTQAALELERFIQKQMWKPLGFASLKEWRETRFGNNRFYELGRVTKLLKAGVSESDLAEMKLTNIHNLARLPEDAWEKERWLRAAMEKGVAEFEEEVDKFLDEKGLEPDRPVRRGFSIPKSLADRWGLALNVAEAEGASTMTAKVEAIVSEYLAGDSAVAGKNREQWYAEIGAESA